MSPCRSVLSILALLLLGLSPSRAVPLDAPQSPSEIPGTRLFAPRPGGSVPPEILDQFGQQKTASMSELILAARSKELRERLAKSPNDRKLMHELGTVFYHQGVSREAIALWAAASKQDPNLAPADVMAAVQEVFSLLARGDAATAQIKLTEAEKRFARHPHFHLIRAEQAVRSGNLAEAERAYKTAQSLGPRLFVVQLNLARFYDYARRDPDMVLRQYESAVSLAPDRDEGWMHLGAFQFRRKQPDAALASFRKAKSLNALAPMPEHVLGDLNAREGDNSAAVRWYRSALSAKPSPTVDDEIRGALAEVLLALGLHAEARTELEIVLKRQESAKLVFALATIDEAQGNPAAAEQRYRRALELAPGNPMTANNLAMLLIKTGRQPGEAVKLAVLANRALPGNAIIQGTYGCALAETGRYSEAIRLLEPVVAATPKEAWSRYCLGKALIAEKRPVEGRHHLTRVLQIDSGFVRKRETEKLLGSGR